MARDRLHEAQWAEAGWRVFIVWECELRPAVRKATLGRLYNSIVGRRRQFTYQIAEPDDDLMVAEGEADNR